MVDNDDDFDIFSAEERAAAEKAYLRAMGRIGRRHRREQAAYDLSVIKAAQKAAQQMGLSVRRATVDGLDIEFGQPDPPIASSVNEWDAEFGTASPPQIRQ
jgi:hypothetical protein